MAVGVTRVLRRPALLLLPLAFLAGVSPRAAARAPSVSEQGSLDWILEHLRADREEDGKGPRVDPMETKIQAYAKGESALDEWLPVAEIVKNREARSQFREKATSALIDRLRAEVVKGTEYKVLKKVRKDILLVGEKSLLKLMNADDAQSRNCIARIIQDFFPQNNIEWRPDDPPTKRNRAYSDLLKYLNKQ